MKKTLLTFSLIIVFTLFASAQELQFVYNGKALADNEVVTITDYTKNPFGEVVLKFAPIIKNNSDRNMQVKVVKDKVKLETGVSSMCFAEACSTGAETPLKDIKAKSETKDFYAEFLPNTATTEILKYTAKENNLGGTSTTVEVHYKYAPSSVKNLGFTQFAVLQVGGTCHIVYSNNSDIQMKVYSITGNTLGSYTLSASNTSFDLPITNYKGIAILSFTDKNGKTAAEKIILK
ncbi:MAG TPA: hypothetical protein GXZ87_05875 [Bacteroidales bacterium]|nr:hypothetical protein [Bacteroidales bacterium]